MKITFLKGDATNPQGTGDKIICHICNDIDRWGAGFVMALSKKWDAPEKAYHSIPKKDMVLGNVQLVAVEPDITVANMIGQRSIRKKNSDYIPIRYDAVRECLEKVNKHAVENNATLHMPRIGCGLAGGDWFEIEKIIHEVVTVDVTVYDFE